MDKEIIIGKITVFYDLETIISEVKELEWDGGSSENKNYSTTEIQFSKRKEKFLKTIEFLDEGKITKLVESNAKITKKGLLDMRSSQVVLDSDIPMHCWTEYGSYQYDSPGLRLDARSNSVAGLVYDEYIGYNESF